MDLIDNTEYKYESLYGERFVHEKEQLQASDMVARIAFNKTKNVTGVLRALSSGHTPPGHGEPSFQYTNYGLITKDYDISRLSSGDIIQFV